MRCSFKIDSENIDPGFITIDLQRKRTIFGAPCEGTVLQRVPILPVNVSLEPVAIGAAAEATTRLKPPTVMGANRKGAFVFLAAHR
jgi:hypothetical protein